MADIFARKFSDHWSEIQSSICGLSDSIFHKLMLLKQYVCQVPRQTYCACLCIRSLLDDAIVSSSANCRRPGLRSASSSSYLKPRLRTKHGQRAFCFCGAAEWNLKWSQSPSVLQRKLQPNFVIRNSVLTRASAPWAAFLLTRDSTGTGIGTVPAWNSVVPVRSRNIFCSGGGPCKQTISIVA